MENLIKCSTVLYDKDISDKMKEITSLKRQLLYYETPKIEYSNLEEWETKKKESYQIIKNGLDKLIIKSNFENRHMLCNRLITILQQEFPYYIKQALNIITKKNNKEWIENISYNIIYGIEGFLHGFLTTGIWNLLYSHLDSKTMSNLIYNNIIWQLDKEEDIAIFTCEICGKKDTYINDNNICCFDCEETDD